MSQRAPSTIGDLPAPKVLLLGHVGVAAPAAGDAPVMLRGLAGRLLIMLAIAPDSGCDDEVLIERLWAGTPPRNASFSLRNQVTALRRLLHRDAIVRTSSGYRLDRASCLADVERFDLAVAAASSALESGGPHRALDLVNEALSLVRGPALAEVRGEGWAVGAASAIDERVRRAEELWIQVALVSSPVVELLPRLRVLAEAEPLRERRWAVLIDTYSSVGRRTDALRAAHEARRHLAAVGLKAGDVIVEAEQRALAAAPSAPAALGLPRLLATRVEPCVGRAGELARLGSANRLALVVGSAGLGKTRLLAEYAWEMTLADKTVVYVRADGVADEPRFVSAMARDLLAAGERSEVDHALRPLLRRGELPAVALDPAAVSAMPRRALQQLVDDVTLGGGLAMLLDDAHLLRADERALVRQLVERAPEGATFVVAGRPPADGASPWWSEFVRPGAPLLELEPLAVTDVVGLVRLAGGGSVEAESAGAALWEVTRGHPLVTAMAVVEWRRRGRLDGSSIGWRTAVDQSLADLDDDERVALTVAAVIDRPVAPQVLEVAAGRGPTDLAAAIGRLMHRRVLDRDGAGHVRVVSDWHGSLARSAAPASLSGQISRRIVAADGADDSDPGLVFAALAELPDRSASELARFDGLFVRVVRDLLASGAVTSARDIAVRYLDATVGGDATSASVTSQLTAATLLLSCVDTAGRGVAVLEVAAERARLLDEPALLADAMLARGPVDMGGRRGRGVAEVAESLARRVAHDDVRRRVQLLCWAAHHRINVGEAESALALLEQAEEVAAVATEATWRALVLAVRAQAHLGSRGSPALAVESRVALDRWASGSGSLTAVAASALLGAGHALAAGTFAEVDDACRRVEEVARLLPRPDLDWYPSAARAAMAAVGADPASARPAIDAAAALGRGSGVSGALPTSLVQHSVVAILAESLGGMVAVLESAVTADEPRADRLALFGLACLHNGEIDRAVRCADRLGSRRPLLPPTGVAWGLVAMAATELAWRLRHTQLAELVWGELGRWSGWGLTMNGVAYFGAVDLWLGACAASIGRREVGAGLLTQGVRQDSQRGAVAWARRGESMLAELLG